MSNQIEYDVVIIGGGIQGAGAALACVSAGYRCLVLEKNQLASATSGASSKLIHGGLRYLETGELPLVYECLNERQWLLSQASDLVHAMPFYIPIYQDSSRSQWEIFVGLSVYAALSRFGKYSGFKRVPKKDWDSLTGLTQDGLVAVFQYWDATTDDKQLTHAVMQLAESFGATVCCESEMLSAKRDNHHYTVEYKSATAIETVQAYFFINAAGPWVNDIQSRCVPAHYQLPVDLVQGIHLQVKGSVLSNGILYLEHPEDGRVVFVMPWQGDTLVGTTEKTLNAPEEIAPSDEEIAYLQRLWEFYFPEHVMEILDVMAGARVLPKNDGNIFKRSREARLLIGKQSLTIYGGKLTSFRAVSKKVVKEVAKQLGKRQPIADFNELELPLKTI